MQLLFLHYKAVMLAVPNCVELISLLTVVTFGLGGKIGTFCPVVQLSIVDRVGKVQNTAELSAVDCSRVQ